MDNGQQTMYHFWYYMIVLPRRTAVGDQKLPKIIHTTQPRATRFSLLSTKPVSKFQKAKTTGTLHRIMQPLYCQHQKANPTSSGLAVHCFQVSVSSADYTCTFMALRALASDSITSSSRMPPSPFLSLLSSSRISAFLSLMWYVGLYLNVSPSTTSILGLFSRACSGEKHTCFILWNCPQNSLTHWRAVVVHLLYHTTVDNCSLLNVQSSMPTDPADIQQTSHFFGCGVSLFCFMEVYRNTLNHGLAEDEWQAQLHMLLATTTTAYAVGSSHNCICCWQQPNCICCLAAAKTAYAVWQKRSFVYSKMWRKCTSGMVSSSWNMGHCLEVAVCMQSVCYPEVDELLITHPVVDMTEQLAVLKPPTCVCSQCLSLGFISSCWVSSRISSMLSGCMSPSWCLSYKTRRHTVLNMQDSKCKSSSTVEELLLALRTMEHCCFCKVQYCWQHWTREMTKACIRRETWTAFPSSWCN